MFHHCNFISGNIPVYLPERNRTAMHGGGINLVIRKRDMFKNVLMPFLRILRIVTEFYVCILNAPTGLNIHYYVAV